VPLCLFSRLSSCLSLALASLFASAYSLSVVVFFETVCLPLFFLAFFRPPLRTDFINCLYSFSPPPNCIILSLLSDLEFAFCVGCFGLFCLDFACLDCHFWLASSCFVSRCFVHALGVPGPPGPILRYAFFLRIFGFIFFPLSINFSFISRLVLCHSWFLILFLRLPFSCVRNLNTI